MNSLLLTAIQSKTAPSNIAALVECFGEKAKVSLVEMWKTGQVRLIPAGNLEMSAEYHYGEEKVTSEQLEEYKSLIIVRGDNLFVMVEAE